MIIPLEIFPGDEEVVKELLRGEIIETQKEASEAIQEVEDFLQEITIKKLSL